MAAISLQRAKTDLFMKKKLIFTGLFLLAILGALTLLLSSISIKPAPQSQAELKQLRERIRHLEELTATLEKKLNEKQDSQVKHATFTPDGKVVITHDDKQVRVWHSRDGKEITPQIPTQPAPSGNTPAASVPPGWKAHEFNGLSYYLVPLTTR